MQPDSLTFIFLNALLINNIVLASFLGLCPFVGVSAKLNTALPMGLAVVFVMFIASNAAYGINAILVRFDMEYLRLISYIAVIASAVQLVEMVVKKVSQTLYRLLGIYLPLITTNCAILGVALFQTSREYAFGESLVYSLGTGFGFMLAIVLMAGLREKVKLAALSDTAAGAAITFMLAGILSMAFMGFAGLGG
ncbi:MAG: electron transport complex protein RnfA [Spirochaetota bacterium]